MSIASALETALSGLQATQAQIQVISGNVANLQTPGYSRETLPQETVVTSVATGVQTGAVQRVVDQVLNTNLTDQMTTTSAASTLDTYYKQIETLLGQVSNGASVNAALDKFSSAMQAVATSPQDPVAQGAAVSAGQSLAQTLNQLSAGIQSIRQGTDAQIAGDVKTLNTALSSIAKTNAQISQLQAEGQSTAALQDQRDQALQQVAQLIGVSSFVTGDGSMVVISTSGQTLVDAIGAGTFSYTPAGNVTATTALSGIKLNGIDITNQITTGSLGSLRQLRDTDLPGLTAQLNQFTNNLFNATAVLNSGVILTNSGGSLATADKFTATIDGNTYTTLPLPSNPAMTDVANALNAQFKARASVAMSGGPPLAGDVFSATIDGTPFNTTALAGGGPFSSTDVVNALNSTLTAINVPVTVGTSVAGDKLDVTLNGTTYTTGALPASATIAQMASAIQAAIPAGFTATVNGSNIQINDTTGILKTATIALHPGGTGTETFGAGVQTSTFTAGIDASGNIAVADSSGNPISLSLSKLAGPGTETFAPAKLTTLAASVSGGNLEITDSSGAPMTVALATNPIFTAGTPVAGTPSTIDFTQTSGSFNAGQTFDVVVDGTDYGSTAALTTGSTGLANVAAAIQSVFTAKGVALTATMVGGKIRISDPSGNPITASLTLNGGPGSEAFSVNTTMSPLNTTNSGLGATNDANHFFAAVNIATGVDNSATIQVNPSLLANNSLLLNGASGADPSISQNLFANLGANYTFAAAGAFTTATTTSLGNYSGQILGQAASTSAAATSNSTFQTQLQSQLASQAGSVSGVNIDEELSNLIQYQNAYGANARVLTTIQTLYDTLMKM